MDRNVGLAQRLLNMIGDGGTIKCDGRSTRSMCDDIRAAAELIRPSPGEPVDGRAGRTTQADRDAAHNFDVYVTGGSLRGTEVAELAKAFRAHRLAALAEGRGK